MTTTMIYETRDGERFEGGTAEAVVNAMRRSSMNEETTMEAYLAAAAARYARFENVIVRADNPDNFLADLTAAGAITKVTP